MNKNGEPLTGWAAILDVIQKGGVAFCAILVLAGILWLDSQERISAEESRVDVLKEMRDTQNKQLEHEQKLIEIEKERNELLRRFITVLELQERYLKSEK